MKAMHTSHPVDPDPTGSTSIEFPGVNHLERYFSSFYFGWALLRTELFVAFGIGVQNEDNNVSCYTEFHLVTDTITTANNLKSSA
jgi:hypothetical protein